jgi:hypothetical protein
MPKPSVNYNSNVRWFTITTNICIETGEILTDKMVKSDKYVYLKNRTEKRIEKKDVYQNGLLITQFIKHLNKYYEECKQQKLEFPR